MKYIMNHNIANSKVLLRVDFNVPISNGIPANFSRIDACIPTIKLLLENNNQLVIMSHLGRPKTNDDRFSLQCLFESRFNLEEYLALKIPSVDLKLRFCKHYINNGNIFSDNNITLLENLRFHPEEQNNDQEFARKLSQLGDCYINEAFSCSHRKHASIVGIPQFLTTFYGVLVEKEINTINSFISSSYKPTMLLLGGAKARTKIPVISHLANKMDAIAIGGAVANTFMKADGIDIQESLYEPDMISCASILLKQYRHKIHLPSDYIIHQNRIVDIGENTRQHFSNLMDNVDQIIWNGPLGFVEGGFISGTQQISDALLRKDKISLIGGGDTLAFCSDIKNAQYSTGGGAFLEYISGIKLPGLQF